MIAVDTNILVYAHRAESPWYQAADACLAELAEGTAPWAIPWPCLHEFLAIVTHPRVYSPPTPLADAILQIECWLESPTLEVLGELGSHWRDLKTVLEAGKVTGAAVHDARIAAICISHGVKMLWSADRDFSRYGELKVSNPLLSR